MTHTTLSTYDGQQRCYSSQQGGFEQWQAMPCLRCGVCCTKWQPQLDKEEASRIAREMDISLRRFLKEYAIKYPVKRDSYVIRCRDGACIFLRYEGDYATCAIHAFKPQTCRDWMPSLSRRECQAGFKKRGLRRQIVCPQELYASPADLETFCRLLRSQTGSDRSSG